MENLKKKGTCWLVPTDNKENALKGYKDKSLLFEHKPKYYEGSKIITEFTQHYHLYITSNEQIKERDYVYHRLDNKPILVTKDLLNGDIRRFGYSKVVISTDKSLNLPQPSQGFINAYIEAFNKGQQVTDVMVEYNNDVEYWESRGGYKSGGKFKIFKKPEIGEYNCIMDYYPIKIKTDSNNCATITKTKDSWSRDEVIELLHKAFKAQSFDFDNNLDRISLNNWIEQNL